MIARALYMAVGFVAGVIAVGIARVCMSREPLEEAEPEIEPDLQAELDELRRSALYLYLSQQPREVYRAEGEHPEINTWTDRRWLS